MKNLFYDVSARPSHPNWNKMIKRKKELYQRNNDLRTEFGRDYTRIIHCNAYRRLKHKTQVFFSPENDHICTRIEHVNHVESISYTISNHFGLNTELTKAISTSHDLGHSPFGHQGEFILSAISKRELGISFWHEKNGLDLVDNFELLEDDHRIKQNLNLSYAVRDGIISHCGEIDENSIRPREEWIDLKDYTHPNQYAPYTWEACVVKVADKISYIGRDIEDAINVGILDDHLEELSHILENHWHGEINNTVIINNLVYDLCQNSSPKQGLCFSDNALIFMNKIKQFNYQNIYSNPLLIPSCHYFEVVLNQIYDTLKSIYQGKETLNNLKTFAKFYPKLVHGFSDWLVCYFDVDGRDSFENIPMFSFNHYKDYLQSILYYISGMTDQFAIEIYKEIIGF